MSVQSISKSFERCLIASIDKRIYSDTVTSYLKHENRYFGFTCVYFECKNKFYTTLIKWKCDLDVMMRFDEYIYASFIQNKIVNTRMTLINLWRPTTQRRQLKMI